MLFPSSNPSVQVGVFKLVGFADVGVGGFVEEEFVDETGNGVVFGIARHTVRMSAFEYVAKTVGDSKLVTNFGGGCGNVSRIVAEPRIVRVEYRANDY